MGRKFLHLPYKLRSIVSYGRPYHFLPGEEKVGVYSCWDYHWGNAAWDRCHNNPQTTSPCPLRGGFLHPSSRVVHQDRSLRGRTASGRHRNKAVGQPAYHPVRETEDG